MKFNVKETTDLKLTLVLLNLYLSYFVNTVDQDQFTSDEVI